MNRILSVLLVFSLLLFATLSLAEDNGRLADGRAYRTDDQGYQLVDYIAELELKIEELQTQIISLNNEQRFPPKNKKFAETNLIDPAAVSQQACPVCPQQNCPTTEANSCLEESKQLLALEQEVSLLKTENRQLATNLSELAESNSQQGLGEQQLFAAKQEAQKKALNESLTTQRQLAQLQATLQQKDLLLTQSNENYQELDDLYAQTTQELEQIKTSNRQNRESLEQKESQLAVLKLQKRTLSDNQKKLQQQSAQKPAAGSGRSAALTHLQKRLGQDISLINTLLRRRDSLVKKYAKTKRKNQLSLNLTKPVSASGLSLKELERRIFAAQRFGDVGKLQKEVFQLKRGIQSDVTTLTRLLQF